MADIPPPPPSSLPPPPAPAPGVPPPQYQGLPPGSPGYMPQPIGPTSGPGLGVQIAGARSSIIVGVIGVVVPVATALLFGGSVFYFYVLPIFGAIYGIRAMMRGFVLGGAIGLGLNILAGIVSLTVSGLINPG